MVSARNCDGMFNVCVVGRPQTFGLCKLRQWAGNSSSGIQLSGENSGEKIMREFLQKIAIQPTITENR